MRKLHLFTLMYFSHTFLNVISYDHYLNIVYLMLISRICFIASRYLYFIFNHVAYIIHYLSALMVIIEGIIVGNKPMHNIIYA